MKTNRIRKVMAILFAGALMAEHPHILAHVLGDLGSKEALEKLQEVWEKDPMPMVREIAGEAVLTIRERLLVKKAPPAKAFAGMLERGPIAASL